MAVATIARRPASDPAAPPALGSVMGDNRRNPSEDAVRDLEEMLSQRDGFVQRCVDLIGGATRAIATDEDTAGRCGELVKQIGAAERVIEDARKSVKEPYFEAGKAVDAAARAKAGPLADAKATVQDKLNTFLREERARQQAEARRAEEARQAEQRRLDDERRAREAEQRQREEEARAANQPVPEPAPLPEPEPVVLAPVAAPEPTRIRSDFGALTSGKTVWKHEIVDIEVAFMAVSNNENVRAAIDKAIGAMVRGGVRTIEGVRVYSDIVAQVR